MVQDHPTPEVLEAWLRAELPVPAGKAVLVHLLHGCAGCSRAVAARWPGLRAAPVDPAVYDFPVARVLRRVLGQVRAEESERERASGQLATLLRTGKAPTLRPEELAGGAGWQWCEELLDGSRELLRDDPKGAVMLAALAATLAEHRLAEDRFPPGQLADRRARARAELGNARRAADDLAGAELDLAGALEHYLQGTRDPLLGAWILDLCASLLRDQRRLDEAGRCLDRVYVLYRDHGKPQLAGRALISKGLILGERQDYVGALRLLEQGLMTIDREEDPHLAFVAVHSTVCFLAEAGSFRAASYLLDASRPLYDFHAGDVDLVKLRWVEGKIAAGMGELGQGEEAFAEARNEFTKLGKPYDVALVTLDLAAVYLRQGRPAEVGRLAAEMLTTFRALGIRPRRSPRSSSWRRRYRPGGSPWRCWRSWRGSSGSWKPEGASALRAALLRPKRARIPIRAAQIRNQGVRVRIRAAQIEKQGVRISIRATRIRKQGVRIRIQAARIRIQVT
ncbi:MAG TPA: hypothetical protein VFE33_32480 [Thermoanaerobaculia bacterium]|nr:hypothetical protein [Thermoanaerobaculia bacterium]